eukprot:358829-Chlamydomonas_euryale.AAC.20
MSRGMQGTLLAMHDCDIICSCVSLICLFPSETVTEQGARLLLMPPPHPRGACLQRLMSPDPAARPDAASVLATCEKQKQMGILPLQPSQPRPGRQSLRGGNGRQALAAPCANLFQRRHGGRHGGRHGHNGVILRNVSFCWLVRGVSAASLDCWAPVKASGSRIPARMSTQMSALTSPFTTRGWQRDGLHAVVKMFTYSAPIASSSVTDVMHCRRV